MWALNDLHFTIQRGEAVGVIGMNGAGKSVLLKTLARITHPTRGYAEVYGRVGALLEVGTGFHPEMTGRQNIYLSGVMLGIKKAAIDEKFAGIVAFAGIGDFLDTPVKRYSSGMAVRLGFAVAIHMDQEILLIDEVLSIADEAFKQKCVHKLKELIGQGRTLLIVSHQHELLQTLCSRTLFLHNGAVQFDGATAEAIARYDMMRKQGETSGRGTLP
jgi:lipopolysaccharide transport system ATP-binding protein